MNFVNNGITYLKDLLAPMPPAWRIATGTLLAAVLVGLVWLFQTRTASPDGYLLGGRPFTATELGAVEAAFAKAGLSGAVVEGNRIRVPTGQEPQYILAMAENNALPADFHDGFAREMTAAGPFMDPKVREEVIKNARQQELAKIIRSMPHVESAAVHWEQRKGPGLSRQTVSSASVSVKPVLSRALDAQDVKKIRHLVAAAIGLKPENVTVADLSPQGGVYVGTESGGMGEGEDHKYLSVMRAHQKLVEETIAKALSYVQGVSVSATVELNPELESSKSATTFDNKKAGTLDRQDQSTQKTVQATTAGGRPGLAAQQPGAANVPASLAGGNTTTTEDASNSTIERSIPAHQTESSKLIGLTPKVVRVSVSVPMTYYEAIWRRRNPPAAGQPARAPTEAELKQIEDAELPKIQRHVAQLIPAADPTNPAALVQVASFFPSTATDIPAVSFADSALSWLAQSWTTLGTFLLALVALWMLRSLWKSIPQAEPEPLIAAPAPQQPAPAANSTQAEGPPKSTEPAPRLLRRSSNEGSLRDELAALVKEDPTAAANIIKGWIGSAN